VIGSSVSVSADGRRIALGTGSILHQDHDKPSAAYTLAQQPDGSWQPHHTFEASNGGVLDLFGGAVALGGNGTVLVVAATEEDSDGKGIGGAQNDDLENAGAVYIFE
jgi:hypothetical protein